MSFDPESGEVTPVAQSSDGWAKELLRNHRELTGSPLAHSWQAVHAPIPAGKRLLPKILFALGGRIDDENLFAAALTPITPP